MSAIPNTETNPEVTKVEEPPVYYEHKWLFVIIPVETYREERAGYSKVEATKALLAAYCKHCDSYYTKPLVWSSSRAVDGHAGLERFGCVGPEGRFI